MRIGVIGCGAVFEAFYLDVLRKQQAEGLIDLVLLVDSQARNIEAARRYFPLARAANDLGAALGNTSLDRAIVLTPPATHAPIMQELAGAGVHAYCEKPLAVSPAEARTISESFSSQDLICRVGYVRRLFPNFKAFRSLYSNLGPNRKLSISDGEVFRWPIKTGAIFAPAEAGGGVVWDKLSHNLDIVQWIAGLRSIERVRTNCKPGRVPVDVLVEGTTDQGEFRIAVSWTAGLANLVSATDGIETIESKNGLTQSLRVSSTKSSFVPVETGISSYGEAVGAALDAFFRLENWKQESVLATAAQSVVLTDLLSSIDRAARAGGL